MRKLVNVAVGSFASFGHQPVTSGPRPKQRTSSRQPSYHPANVACPRRRGDRITMSFAAVHESDNGT
jgi:hypothetical protein